MSEDLDKLWAQATPVQPTEDLDKLWESATPVQQSQGPSEMESFARGGLQGATFGFADEIGAGVQAAAQGVSNLVGAGDGTPALEVYRKARDENRAQEKRLEAANPLAYGAGQVTGGIGSALLSGGAGAGAGLGGALRGGAVMGGIQGLGDSEADLTRGDIAGAVRDTAGGAALGAVASTIGYGVGKGVDAVKSKLANWAASKAAEATSELEAREAAKVAKQIASAKGAYGSSVQSASRDLEVLAREADALPPGELRDSIRSLLSSPEGEALRASVAGNKLATAPERMTEMAAKRAELEALKEGAEQSTAEGVAAARNGVWSEQVKPRLVKYGTRIALPTIGGYVGAEMDGAQGSAIGTAAGGVAAAALGHPGTAFSNMLKNPAAREKAFSLVSRVLQSNPARLGRFAPVLQKAASRGPQALAVSHFVLEQNSPAYRQHMASIDKGEDDE